MTDWQIGDIAECIDGTWANAHPDSREVAPRYGQRLLVTDVDTSRAAYCADCGCLHIQTGLAFVGDPVWFWNAKYFRKVEPTGEDRTVEAKEAVPA